MLKTKKSKQLALLGALFIFVVLVVNPFQLTTIIVDNMGGGNGGEADIQVTWQILDSQGNVVQDGDTVSGVLTIGATFTGSDVGYITNVDLIVDGSKWCDMVAVGTDESTVVPGNTYTCTLDTTQLADGEHEVELLYEYTLPDGNNGVSSLSLFGFSTDSGGVDFEGRDLTIPIVLVFVGVAVFVVLLKAKKVR